MTALRFPAEIAVGEVSWEDAREPNGWGHLLAIGVVEVPDGTAVDLSVYTVAEVSVSGQPGGIFTVPAGAEPLHGPGRGRAAAGRSVPLASSPAEPDQGYLAAGNAGQRAA
jgi:hypothetical protein